MLFEIDKKAQDKIQVWEDNHNCTITNEGAIGGKLTYSFTSTSLGTVIKVKCACGIYIDVTEYDLW